MFLSRAITVSFLGEVTAELAWEYMQWEENKSKTSQVGVHSEPGRGREDGMGNRNEALRWERAEGLGDKASSFQGCWH